MLGIGISQVACSYEPGVVKDKHWEPAHWEQQWNPNLNCYYMSARDSKGNPTTERRCYGGFEDIWISDRFTLRVFTEKSNYTVSVSRRVYDSCNIDSKFDGKDCIIDPSPNNSLS